MRKSVRNLIFIAVRHRITTDRAIGPWDQDYIGEARPFADMYYGQGNGTMAQRLNWGGSSICCQVLQIEQWDHGTKLILGRFFHLLPSTTDRAIGPWDQDYNWVARPFAAMFFRQSNDTM
jgi:hypothetical protein